MPGLCLEIEFLTGRYAAADPFTRERPEWPPSPARAFAALAAAAFEEDSEDAKETLRWLEALAPPAISAQSMLEQLKGRLALGTEKPPKHFVPVNDTSANKFGAIEREGRQPRFFPSLALANPRVSFLWPDTVPNSGQLAILARLAALVPYVGESASVARLAWTVGADVSPTFVPDCEGTLALRVPYRGQMQRFEENFRAGRNPAAGVQVRYALQQQARADSPGKTFSPPRYEWFVFRIEDSPGLRVTHALHLTLAVRQALVAHAEAVAKSVPPVLHGHAGDGDRLREDHVIVAPLPHVRGMHADGRVLGFAVLLPNGLPESDRRVCFEAIARLDEIRLAGGNAFRVHRVLAGETRSTLRLNSWIGPSRFWITVTPAVLNRFSGKRPDKTLDAIVLSMCQHVGLPAPQACMFRPESFAPGIPHARHFLVRRPHWRPLPHGHLRLEFTEPVTGPIVIGSCRHYGLGLMMPFPEEPTSVP